MTTNPSAVGLASRRTTGHPTREPHCRIVHIERQQREPAAQLLEHVAAGGELLRHQMMAGAENQDRSRDTRIDLRLEPAQRSGEA